MKGERLSRDRPNTHITLHVPALGTPEFESMITQETTGWQELYPGNPTDETLMLDLGRGLTLIVPDGRTLDRLLQLAGGRQER